MRQHRLIWILALLTGLGCGGDDLCGSVDCSNRGACYEIYGQAACDCYEGFHAEALECIADETDDLPTARVLVADIHAAADLESTVSLRQMLAGDDVADADLKVYETYIGGQDFPVVAQSTGVSAIDLGSTTEYHDVDSVPADGYQPDGVEMIIGNTYQSGGTCSGGFTMSNHVFALALPDGTYAKVQVRSAKDGRLEILCFRQADGTRNTATQP